MPVCDRCDQEHDNTATSCPRCSPEAPAAKICRRVLVAALFAQAASGFAVIVDQTAFGLWHARGWLPSIPFEYHNIGKALFSGILAAGTYRGIALARGGIRLAQREALLAVTLGAAGFVPAAFLLPRLAPAWLVLAVGVGWYLLKGSQDASVGLRLATFAGSCALAYVASPELFRWWWVRFGSSDASNTILHFWQFTVTSILYAALFGFGIAFVARRSSLSQGSVAPRPANGLRSAVVYGVVAGVYGLFVGGFVLGISPWVWTVAISEMVCALVFREEEQG